MTKLYIDWFIEEAQSISYILFSDKTDKADKADKADKTDKKYKDYNWK